MRPATMMSFTQSKTPSIRESEMGVDVTLNRYDMKFLPRYYHEKQSIAVDPRTFMSIEEESGNMPVPRRRDTSNGIKKLRTNKALNNELEFLRTAIKMEERDVKKSLFNN